MNTMEQVCLYSSAAIFSALGLYTIYGLLKYHQLVKALTAAM